MVTVGVVLLLLAGVLTADLVLENSGQTEVMIMGQSLSFDVWGLFVLGLATGVLVVAGVQITLQGFARDRYRRRIERHRAEELAAMTRAAPASVPAPAPVPGPASTGPQRLKTPPQSTGPQSTGLQNPGPQNAGPQPAGRTVPPTASAPVAAGSSPAATPTAPGQTSRRRSSASSARRTGGGAAPAPAPAPATSAGTGAPATGGATQTSHRGDRVVARVSDLRRKKGEGDPGSDEAASQRPLGSTTAP